MTWKPDDCLPDVATLSVPALIQLNRRTLYKLLDLKVVHTLDNLTGGLAETLVSIAYNGKLAPNSQKGYDVIAETGERLQVKARALDHDKVGSNTTGKIGPGDYDKMIVVLLNPEDLSVGKAFELTPEVVNERKTKKNVLVPNKVLMGLGDDKTELLRAAARELYNWPEVGRVGT